MTAVTCYCALSLAPFCLPRGRRDRQSPSELSLFTRFQLLSQEPEAEGRKHQSRHVCGPWSFAPGFLVPMLPPGDSGSRLWVCGSWEASPSIKLSSFSTEFLKVDFILGMCNFVLNYTVHFCSLFCVY